MAVIYPSPHSLQEANSLLTLYPTNNYGPASLIEVADRPPAALISPPWVVWFPGRSGGETLEPAQLSKLTDKSGLRAEATLSLYPGNGAER